MHGFIVGQDNRLSFMLWWFSATGGLLRSRFGEVLCILILGAAERGWFIVKRASGRIRFDTGHPVLL